MKKLNEYIQNESQSTLTLDALMTAMYGKSYTTPHTLSMIWEDNDSFMEHFKNEKYFEAFINEYRQSNVNVISCTPQDDEVYQLTIQVGDIDDLIVYIENNIMKSLRQTYHF